jgi:hypothetical protein
MSPSNSNEPPKLRRRRGISVFESLIPLKRPYGGFHPPKTRIWTFENENRINTDGLNENTDSIVFAWELLRRNKYYMALVERKKGAIPESEWGFRWDKKIERTHGLMELKNYWEKFDEGKPPRWIGLDAFAEQVQAQQIAKEAKQTQVTLKPGQIAVVFDLANLFHESPWRIQLFALQDHLERLSKEKLKGKIVQGKTHHKSVLLRRLRTLDALSSGCDFTEASAKAHRQQVKEEMSSKGIIASPFENLVINTDKKPTVYEDLDGAYKLIYHHGYLKLAAGDGLYKLDGDRLRPYTYSEIMGEEEKRQIQLKDLQSRIYRI